MARERKEKPSLSTTEAKAMQFWRENPVDAVKDWFKVTPDDWQGDVLNGLLGKNAKFDRMAVKSAHGPGKTAVEAWTGWVFLNVYEDSRVVATAPTQAQLGDILWPEYAKWYSKMPQSMQDMWLISGGHIRSIIKPKTWFAVSRTSNRPENLQGFHGSHILVQCDEASGVPQPVFEVIEGALSEAGEEGKIAKLQLAGNPNFTTGELFDAFHRNQSMYERITVTGDPLLLGWLEVAQGAYHKEHGRVFFSKRVKEKYRANMEKKYGLEGAVYDVRVRGVFPRQDDFAVIPLEWAERNSGRELPGFDDVADGVTLVLDPARFGGNESVLGAFRKGVPCAPLECKPKTSTHAAADMVSEAKRKYEAMGLQVVRVIVDEPGVGGGVIDELNHRGIPVTPYNGGVTMKAGIDPEDECRMFANRRARDYWLVRRRLELNNLPLPGDDGTLVAQMASIRYDYNEQQKIVIESKKKLTDRLGAEASPDRADVIVMGCAPWTSLQGTGNVDVGETDIIMGEDRPLAEQELW